MQRIYHVCSLGHSCHIGIILKRLNLKGESYPFDWIKSNFDIIKHCLNDNFKLFLNKSQYKFIEINKCSHLYYDKNGEVMFYHHNPINPTDYEYYQRCVERFNNLLKNSNKKLFISININQQKIPNNINDILLDLDKCLKCYTNNYELLYIYHIKNGTTNHKIIEVNNHIKLLILYTKSKSDGRKFLDESENEYLKKLIICNYNLV